jgi:hypothetical protein
LFVFIDGSLPALEGFLRGAFATGQVVLDGRGAQPALCERAGTVLARRAAADGVAAAVHDGSGLPDCSAAMYSAYQSGQSASCWLVRFSCSPCSAAARRSAAASSADEVNVVASAPTRPGNRAVTSCNSQPLPSGSLNEAHER